MAGDRGLVFVIIGLICVSTLAVLNHGRIGPRSSIHSAVVVSENVLSRGGTVAGESYMLRMRDSVSGEDVVSGTYPELSGSAAEHLPRIRQRLRLAEESGLTPPLH
jgi:hypothetical protein